MAISDVEAKATREAIDQLKGEIAQLETRLQQDRILSQHQGSLKSIGIRVASSENSDPSHSRNSEPSDDSRKG
jgi:hypothetical protein